MVARTGDLETFRQKMAEYAKPSLTGEPSYLTQSADGSFFTVVDVSADGGKHCASISLAARVLPDFLIIEHDTNNKPLVDALVQAGIPRKKIILAYAGESVPPTV
ncbi:MAG: XisI protein [Anaerolineae bacterium]|nr:XisI protein [Anaerolineae bacterium]